MCFSMLVRTLKKVYFFKAWQKIIKPRFKMNFKVKRLI